MERFDIGGNCDFRLKQRNDFVTEADRIGTFAEGLATRYTFDLTFGILERELDDIVTLTEAELEEGVRIAMRATQNLAEGAGAASLMAAVKMRDQLAGKKIVCVMSGGNLSMSALRRIIA